MRSTETHRSSIETAGYTEIERIGQGGIGTVYRATRASTGVVVAIKVFREVSDESVTWRRTHRELRALAALTGHANVIHVFELLELPAAPALVMEYASGGSVADLLSRRHGILTQGEAILIGRHTAAALVAAHAQGIVHRDIKPQNLLIDAYGQVKLCDFGIASLTRVEGFRTRTGAWSMRYASPEDLEDEGPIGPASDVYSLGATVLHLARGAPPTLRDRLAEWVPPPTDDPELAALDEVLARCLHPLADERPSAGELVDRFEQMSWKHSDRRRALDVDTRSPSERSSSAAHGTPERNDRSSQSVQSLRSVLVGSGHSRPPLELGADQTVHRGTRSIPPRPPVAPPARRRWPLVATVLGIGIMAVIAAVSVAVRVRPSPTEPVAAAASTTVPAIAAAITMGAAPATTPRRRSTATSIMPQLATTASRVVLDVAERPPGLVAVDDPAMIWPFGDVGDCLVQLAADPTLRGVSCEEPHDLQRFAVGELDSDAFPAAFDPDLVQSAVDSACALAFDQFAVGDQLTLDMPVTRPSAASWQQGDRRYQCLIGVERRRVVGDGLR